MSLALQSFNVHLLPEEPTPSRAHGALTCSESHNTSAFAFSYIARAHYSIRWLPQLL